MQIIAKVLAEKTITLDVDTDRKTITSDVEALDTIDNVKAKMRTRKDFYKTCLVEATGRVITVMCFKLCYIARASLRPQGV